MVSKIINIKMASVLHSEFDIHQKILSQALFLSIKLW